MSRNRGLRIQSSGGNHGTSVATRLDDECLDSLEAIRDYLGREVLQRGQASISEAVRFALVHTANWIAAQDRNGE
jgi:hypothetical protein